MKKNICYLICTLLLATSCVDNRADIRRKAIEKSEKYEASFPNKYREIINKYEKKELPVFEKTIQRSGGIFCIVNGIYSWQSLNEKLKNNGYCITLNQDSLSFFIFTESESHKVGYYTNGGDAIRTDTKVIALDISNEVAYILKKEIGGMPPSYIRRSRAASKFKIGASGKSMTSDDVYNFLVSKILIR